MDIEYLWAASDSTQMVRQEDTIRVRRGFEALVRREVTNSSRLIDLLDPNYPWTLSELIRGHRASARNRLDQWQWLSQVLVDAAMQKPEVVVPQIAHLIGRGTESTSAKQPMQRVINYSIDEPFFDSLFISESLRRDVLVLLANCVEGQDVGRDHQLFLRAIKAEAEDRLASSTT
jgi:hypothetical protein